MAGSNWPTIPDPAASLPSLQMCVLAIKESVELLTGQRGPVAQYSVDQQILDIKNTINNGPTSLTARITTIYEATLDPLNSSSLASMVTEITAEIDDARSGQPNLKARITQVDQARIDGDNALATQITTLNSTLTTDVTNINANLSSEATTRVNADSALSSSITTLTTNFNSISASGQMELIAVAGPTGSSAAYEWALTAGSVSCGMTAIAKSGGGGAISFSASSFGLQDSGTYTPVFNYSGGVFTFNAPVSIQTANIANLAVTNAKIGNLAVGNGNMINNAATQGSASSSSGTTAAVVVSIRGTGSVVMFAQFAGTPGSFYNISSIGQLNINVDGLTADSITNSFTQETISGTTYTSLLETTLIYVTQLAAGSHTIQVSDTNSSGIGGVTIVVMELSK